MKPKLRAFIIHLLSSLFIFAIFLTIMLLFWYPTPYFEVNGGWSVLKILIGVDLVLGPILTLVVFRPGKPGLKFDMACIVALQLAALLYGGFVTYRERPAFVVFTVDQFATVTAGAVDFDALQYPVLKPAASRGPRLVEAHFPSDPQERQDLMFAVFSGAKDIHERPELYHPYRPDVNSLRSKSIAIDSITAASPKARQRLERFLNEHGGKPDDYLYLPLTGKNKDIVMVLAAADGQPVGTLSIDPWLSSYKNALNQR